MLLLQGLSGETDGEVIKAVKVFLRRTLHENLGNTILFHVKCYYLVCFVSFSQELLLRRPDI